MNREHVLEDILRGRAADVEIDPGALSAILTAPNPNSERKPDSPDPQSSSPQASSTSTPPSASAAAPKGTSWVGKLARLFVATSLVVAVVAGAGYVYLGSNPTCWQLEEALDTVNSEVTSKVGENPNIALSCDGVVTSLADIRAGLSPENQADFDDNEDDIRAAHKCLTEAAKPLGLTTLFDVLASGCADL